MGSLYAGVTRSSPIMCVCCGRETYDAAIVGGGVVRHFYCARCRMGVVRVIRRRCRIKRGYGLS